MELEKLKKENEDITLLFEQADKNNKELREEIEVLKRQLNEAEKQVNSLTARGLKLYEESVLLKASPELAFQKTEMQFELEMAKIFISSGAFNPALTPEQAYIIIRAGKEMGMDAIEALNSLYIVKGKIELYGKALTNRFTMRGMKLLYENENAEGVTVSVMSEDGVILVSEVVRKNDPILQRSNAMKISEQHKMRFHGLRKLLTFHFAHLIKGAGDLFTDYEEIEEQKKGSRIEKINEKSEKQRVLDQIQRAIDERSMKELERVKAHRTDARFSDSYDEAEKIILESEAREKNPSPAMIQAKKDLELIRAKKEKEVENE